MLCKHLICKGTETKAGSPKRRLFKSRESAGEQGRLERSGLIAFHYSTLGWESLFSACLAQPQRNLLGARLWDSLLQLER